MIFSDMKPEDIILIGVKHSVSAVSRTFGTIHWTTKLQGGLAENFVTVACDGDRVFAHSAGKLYCLDLSNGRVLWTNELRGFGFGLASICIPGIASAPELAVVQAIESARQSAGAASAAA